MNIDHIEFDLLSGNLQGNGKEWEELYCNFRDMSKATGAKKPSESPKPKSLWAMRAARDRDEKFYDLARKEDMPGRTNVWICVMNISKIRWQHWKRRWSASKLPTNVGIWFHSLSLSSLVFAMAFSIAGAKILQKNVGRAVLGGGLTSPGRTGRTASSFSSSSRSSPSLLQRAVEFIPFVPAETLKACALICLHLVAAGRRCQVESLDLGDAWR